MRTGRPLKKHPIADAYDAIVIGSGMGALTTAAVLAKTTDRRVLVLEQHYTAGGFMHSFKRPGYEWDVGVHYVGEIETPGGLGQIIDFVTDGAVRWADFGDTYDEIVIGEDRYAYRRGRDAWRDTMCGYFPSETRAIDRYLKRVESLFLPSRLYFADKVLPRGLSRFVGPALRAPLRRIARASLHDVLTDLTDNPRLRAVLAGQWGDYGLPPREGSFAVHAMVAQHYRRGAYYPVGGSAGIVAAVESVLDGRGGRIATNARVTDILEERGAAIGVRLENGQEVRAPLVISGAGVPATERMLAAGVAKDELSDIVRATSASTGHASLYVGVEGDARDLKLPAHNIWVYPGEDHDAQVAAWRESLDAPLPVAFCSFAAARDPAWATKHPGRSTLEVLTLCDHRVFAEWEGTKWKNRGAEYDERKAAVSERLLEVLYEQVPSVRGKVAHHELSTPLTTAHFAGHPSGEIYGVACTPARFDEHRMRPQTRLKGLWLTGADVCSPGVAGAAIGGVLSAMAITKKNYLSSVLGGPYEPKVESAPCAK